MNSNTILLRFGLDPNDFVEELNEPIVNDGLFIYEVSQKKDNRKCPYCNGDYAYVKDYDYVTISCSENDYRRDYLRIKKVRFKCLKCNKTFTPKLHGLNSHSKISNQIVKMITNDFVKPITFNEIGLRYGLSSSRVVQLFDELVKYVPRLKFNETLCIDEIRFTGENTLSKYCCVLYDFNSKKIVDIIKSRQLPYLDEYFSSISENERNNVKYFVSDMYDGYKTVQRRYFKKSIHIVDLFHVVSQMTNAVNRLRVKTMNKVEDVVLYNFMKTHWKEFLCRKDKISNKIYTPKNSANSIPYVDLVYSCVLSDVDLLEAYNILQDLYKYSEYYTFTESLNFIDYMSDRLLLSNNETLESVGRTYHKWRIEIANGLAKNQNNIHYTNAIAEAMNNHLKTIIKFSYGYHNFERFRKRALLINNYK